MSIDPKDPRLTSYALGELESEDERIEIEKALEESEELTQTVNQIRQTAALMSEELQREPSPSLAPKHRQRIERELRGPVGFFSSSLGKWALGGAAVAAACLIFAMIMIPNLLQSKAGGDTVAQARRQETGALSSHHPRGWGGGHRLGLGRGFLKLAGCGRCLHLSSHF